MQFRKILLALAGIVCAAPFAANALAPVLQGSQGGTGFATTTAGNVGNCLSVVTNSPLTWTFSGCAGGSGSVGNWFTPTTNFNTTANSTSTLIWFKASPVSLAASSTAWFDQINVGSTTVGSMSTSTFNGNVNIVGNIFQNGFPISTSTTIFRIDSNNVGNSWADGTELRPFKTYSAANSFVTARGLTSATYVVAPGTSYTEQTFTFPNIPLTIYGNQSTLLVLSGASVGAGTVTVSSDLSWYDAVIFGNVSLTAASLTNPHSFQGGFIAGNLFFAGNATFNNGAVVDQNTASFPFLSQNASSTLTAGSGSLVNITGSNIQVVINTHGTINLDDDNVQTATNTRYAIMATSTGSVIHINGLSLQNDGTGGGINCANSAPNSAPNAISNLGLTLGAGSTAAIDCGSAASFIGLYTAFTRAGVRLTTTGTDKLYNNTEGLNVDSVLSIASTTGGTPLSVNGAGVFTGTVTAPQYNATNTAATSTFSGGANVGLLFIASTTASSTASNGINLTKGCFAILGVCVSGSGGSTAPGGANTNVQFNDSSAFGGVSTFTYNKTLEELTVGTGNTNTGDTSFVVGENSSATGDYSGALGLNDTATADFAWTIGHDGRNASRWGINIGDANFLPSTAQFEIAIGASSTASATWATAIGASTTASGAGALAVGASTTASGAWSTSMGQLSTSTGAWSFAGGQTSKAIGNWSFSYGLNASAGTAYDLAFGHNAVTSGPGFASTGGSIAFTDGSVKNSYDSFAGPNSSVTGADYSAAMGNASQVFGTAAGSESVFAFGDQVTGSSTGSFAAGSFNTNLGKISLGTGINNTAGLIFGTGNNTTSRLLQHTTDDIAFGHKATVPTLYIGGAVGVSGSGNGKVSIGTPPANATALLYLDIGTADTLANFTNLFEVASSTAAATTTLFSISNTGVASTTNLTISNLGATGSQCLQINSQGVVSANSSACGTGGGSPGGTSGQLQINNSGSFGGVTLSNWGNLGGNNTLGTSTASSSVLTLGTSTAPQLALSDNFPGDFLWTFRTASSSLYLATSTGSFSPATSTGSAFVITNNQLVGVATNTPGTTFSIGNFANFNSSSSTFQNQLFVVGSSVLASNGTSNVGIGTTSPYAQLSINAAGGVASYFSIGSTTSEVLKISPSGSAIFGHGTTTPYGQFSIENTGVDSTSTPVFVISDQGTSTPSFMVAGGNGSVGIGTTSPLGAFSVNGHVFMTGLTASGASQSIDICANASGEIISDSAVCIVSSQRFKHNIISLDNGLNTIMALRPVSFEYNATGNPAFDSRGPQVGFIAEEAVKVDPRLVELGSDGLPHAFLYQNFTAVLTKAIQDFYGEFQKLVAHVSGLETRLNEQQKQIDKMKIRLDSLEKK